MLHCWDVADAALRHIHARLLLLRQDAAER